MCKSNYTYEKVGPIYSIYVGSGPSGRILQTDRDLIFGLCRDVFDSFTVSEARGSYKGVGEDSLVIQVATNNKEHVRNLAARIADLHQQISVGIGEPATHGGGIVYGRIKPKGTSNIS